MPDTTVPDLLDACAENSPDQGVVFPDGRETYPELAASTWTLAIGLWGLGVRPGDHVGLLLHASLDSVRLWLAAARIGAVTVPISVECKPRELTFLIENAGLRLLLTTTDFAPVLHAALQGLAEARAGALQLAAAPELRAVLALDGAPAGFRNSGELDRGTADIADVRAASRAVAASDPVLMLYTSGTTRSPRGCLHSHAALVGSGSAVVERLGLRPDDRFWTPLPLHHCGGFDVAVAALAGRCGMVHVGTFEAGAALAQLEAERATVGFPAFETIWLQVLDHPHFASTDLSALRLVINVGAPERMRAMQARLPHTVQVSCLGMTESFGFCCLGSPDDPEQTRATTSGMPLRHMEVEVTDLSTGRPAPPGTPGEFRFRGAARLMRYHRDPELTAVRIDAAGWFASGDLVVADETGRVRFISRRADMINVGEESIAATELEGVLSEHPAVRIVQVVGAPDGRHGEVVAAFVELKAGAVTTEAELRAFCTERVASFKVPRYVRFVGAGGWPMSGTKVQKIRLKQLLADELRRGGIKETPWFAVRRWAGRPEAVAR